MGCTKWKSGEETSNQLIKWTCSNVKSWNKRNISYSTCCIPREHMSDSFWKLSFELRRCNQSRSDASWRRWANSWHPDTLAVGSAIARSTRGGNKGMDAKVDDTSFTLQNKNKFHTQLYIHSTLIFYIEHLLNLVKLIKCSWNISLFIIDKKINFLFCVHFIIYCN